MSILSKKFKIFAVSASAVALFTTQNLFAQDDFFADNDDVSSDNTTFVSDQDPCIVFNVDRSDSSFSLNQYNFNSMIFSSMFMSLNDSGEFVLRSEYSTHFNYITAKRDKDGLESALKLAVKSGCKAGDLEL